MKYVGYFGQSFPELAVVKLMLMEVALIDLPFLSADEVLKLLYEYADVSIVFGDALQQVAAYPLNDVLLHQLHFELVEGWISISVLFWL